MAHQLSLFAGSGGGGHTGGGVGSVVVVVVVVGGGGGGGGGHTGGDGGGHTRSSLRSFHEGSGSTSWTGATSQGCFRWRLLIQQRRHMKQNSALQLVQII